MLHSSQMMMSEEDDDDDDAQIADDMALIPTIID